MKQATDAVMLPSQQLPPERLGDRIRRLRDARGLKQHQLADLAQVHRNTLLAIEKGRSDPEPETIARIAAVLEVEPSVLWHGTPEGEWPVNPSDRDPGSPGGGSPAEQLLDFLSQRLGHRRVAGELTDKDLIAAAYTLARKHGFTAEDYRRLDAWRDQILEGEKG